MRFRGLRRHALVAALLVLPLLALTVGTFASHEGHGCHFEKDCLACRWAADSVAEAAAPVAQPRPVEAVEASWVEPTQRVAEASPEAVFSRGPPLS
jgi:hypothetical protein